MKNSIKKYGPYAFYAALVLAVLLAFLPSGLKVVATLLLAVLGVVVGVLNISEKEMTHFLLACLAWMVAGSSLQTIIAGLPVFGTTVVAAWMIAVLGNIVTFIGPAAAVVAIMQLYSLTKN